MIREREYEHFCLRAEALRLEDEGLPPSRGKSTRTGGATSTCRSCARCGMVAGCARSWWPASAAAICSSPLASSTSWCRHWPASAPASKVIEAAKDERFVAREAKTWGPALVFERLWERQGLPEILDRHAEGRRFGFDFERVAFALALQRLCAPGSDLQVPVAGRARFGRSSRPSMSARSSTSATTA